MIVFACTNNLSIVTHAEYNLNRVKLKISLKIPTLLIWLLMVHFRQTYGNNIKQEILPHENI
jgi:hypothetical protein